MWTSLLLLSFLVLVVTPIAFLVGLISPKWVRMPNRQQSSVMFVGLFFIGIIFAVIASSKLANLTLGEVTVSDPVTNESPLVSVISPQEIANATPQTIGQRLTQAKYDFPHEVDIRENSVILNFTDNSNSPVLETKDTRILNQEVVSKILLDAGLPPITQTLKSGTIRGERSHYKSQDYPLGEISVSRTVCGRTATTSSYDACISKIVILMGKIADD